MIHTLRKTQMLPAVSSEFKLRESLEKIVNEIILVDSLNEICYDAKELEYKEYGLRTETKNHGTDYGNIDDAITVFHAWKNDLHDETFRVFLEYEVLNLTNGVITPCGITREVGLILKIKKGGTNAEK
jgi:hypothetical protein